MRSPRQTTPPRAPQATTNPLGLRATPELRVLDGQAQPPIYRFDPLSQLPARGIHSEPARLERLERVREHSGAELRTLQQTRLVPEQLANNIENLIGGVELPLGVAGPLAFQGQHVRDAVYLPMATTEGALLASATRGARALTRCGGVHTRVLSQRMERAPFFAFEDLNQAYQFATWAQEQRAAIEEQASRVSRHGKLVELNPVVAGRFVHLRFVYETGDAAGQNMTTACTWHACQWILGELDRLQLTPTHFLVEANLSSDKKASFGSMITGRGTRVTAECKLGADALRQVLKVTPAQLLDAHAAFASGSLQAGMMGHNVNCSNVIAAAFAATGQDVACVHESSLGILHLEPWRDGIYASLVLPSLIVGTVGGGTQLPQQRECLRLMGCDGGGHSARLAEIMAGFCLALDMSTLSAIASGQFATAHERLGRNRPVEWLSQDDLAPAFFERAMAEGLEPRETVTRVESLDLRLGSSIITELSSRRNTSKLLGFFPTRVHTRSPATGTRAHDVMVKAKPVDGEVTAVLHGIAASCSPEVARQLRRHENQLGLADCHRRELAIYRETDPRFVRHVPHVFGLVEDPAREAYVVLLERLNGLTLMDSADDVSGFEQVHLEAVVDGLAQLHAVWFDRSAELLAQPWIGHPPTAASCVDALPLWHALAEHARQEFPEWIGAEDARRWDEVLETMPDWRPELDALPKTLIHNDFNPRNVALRALPDGKLRLCAYDWELATVHVPQRDLAEFLAFTLPHDVPASRVWALVERHRLALQHATGQTLDARQWRRGFVLSLRDLWVTRTAIYTMAHTCRDYAFLPRVFRTLMGLVDSLDPEVGRGSADRSLHLV